MKIMMIIQKMLEKTLQTEAKIVIIETSNNLISFIIIKFKK